METHINRAFFLAHSSLLLPNSCVVLNSSSSSFATDKAVLWDDFPDHSILEITTEMLLCLTVKQR